MSRSANIIIAGGGIAGLAAAIALRQVGEEPLVLEQAPELREIGAGLLLGPNGCAILDRLGVLGCLLGSASSIDVPIWEVLNARGECLSRMKLPRPGEKSISTRRSDLQQALLMQLPRDSIHTGQAVKGVTLTGGTVWIQLDGGGEIQAERLIAADGASSAIRESLRPGSRPNYRGYVGWRALVDVCPSGWESGRVTESWGRGRRFGIAPTGGGRTYWYASANVPNRDLPMNASISSLRQDFANWHSPIPELLQSTREDALLTHPICDRAPVTPTHWGNHVVLIGDAAHPLTPNLGQGASLALEDAWELAAAWHRPNSFQVFSERRRNRVHRLWRASRWLGRLIQWENPLLCAARDASVRTFPGWIAESFLRNLLRHQPTSLTDP
jgi:2-polyprenyl-6-methoxyphenol hydroxylase-like FAD-dependent oxidoreductase